MFLVFGLFCVQRYFKSLPEKFNLYLIFIQNKQSNIYERPLLLKIRLI